MNTKRVIARVSVVAVLLAAVAAVLSFTFNSEREVTGTAMAAPVQPAVVVSSPTSTSPPPAVVVPVQVPPASVAPPAPASTLKLPTPNFKSLGKESMTLFGRLAMPSPKTWGGTMSEPQTAMNFVDQSTCTADNAACPSISIVNLASPEHQGVDPLKEWASQPCEGGPKKTKLEGPALFQIDGQPAEFYRIQCGSDPHASDDRFAWYVPSKKLLVTVRPGTAGAFSAEIAQAAFERITWKK